MNGKRCTTLNAMPENYSRVPPSLTEDNRPLHAQLMGMGTTGFRKVIAETAKRFPEPNKRHITVSI